MSGPAHSRRRSERAPGRPRPYARPRRPISALWGNNGPAQLLIVTNLEITYAYGDFRWGCIRRITWWINRGYRLDRHPRQSAQPLDGPAVRGSAGLPDSLGHKRDITSGRGCVSSVDRCLAPGPRDFPSLSTHSHLIQFPRVPPVFRCPALCGCSRVPVTHRRTVAHLARIGAREMRPRGRSCAPVNARHRAEKSHGKRRERSLRSGLNRAILDMSPGNRKPPAESPARRELCLSCPLNPEVMEMAPENRCELVARAVSAARRARDADRDRFPDLYRAKTRYLG